MADGDDDKIPIIDIYDTIVTSLFHSAQECMPGGLDWDEQERFAKCFGALAVRTLMPSIFREKLIYTCHRMWTLNEKPLIDRNIKFPDPSAGVEEELSQLIESVVKDDDDAIRTKILTHFTIVSEDLKIKAQEAGFKERVSGSNASGDRKR